MLDFSGIKYYRLIPEIAHSNGELETRNWVVFENNKMTISDNIWWVDGAYIMEVIWEDIKKVDTRECVRVLHFGRAPNPNADLYALKKEFEKMLSDSFEEVSEHEINSIKYGLI